MDDAAVLLLAGGNARRFPGKLERTVEGEPMIVRSYRRLRASSWPVYVAAKGSFPAPIDAALDAPLLIDRRPGDGPLAALHSALFADRIALDLCDCGRHAAFRRGHPQRTRLCAA